MANSSINLSSLDFDDLKNNFKEFLKTQSVFKDYNFDGSNINVLLDVMAYNSYLNSFYLNMVASEMFLDSAQKYDSIVSHAKELNYLPRSAHGSTSDVSFDLSTTGISGRLTIPKGTRFSGTNSNGSYTFVTTQASTYTSSNSTYSVANLQLSEGTYFTDSFVVNYDIEAQKYVLTNQNVDIDTLTVSVIENYGASNTVFTRARTLFNLDKTSNVYFLEATHNNQYEIVFGDGFFGRRPVDSSTVLVNYVVTNGTDGNGVDKLSLSDDIGDVNGGIATPSEIAVNTISNSGANQELIESVRFAAPRYFATQQRAVSSDDYASIILSEFAGNISDIAVFGGETLEPKQYGRVIVYVKPSTGTIAADYIKNRIATYLEDFIAIPNRVIIKDPEYIYLWLNLNVHYNPYVTDKSAADIQSAAINSILDYSSNNLEKFNNDLRYSRLVSAIDNADSSITCNETVVRMIKRLAPKLGYSTSYDFQLNNPLFYEGVTVKVGVPHIELYINTYESHFDHSSVISDKFTFTYNNLDYEYSYIADDGEGNLKIYYISRNVISPLTNIGSVNYDTGAIKINNLLVSYYLNHISLYVRPRELDVYADQNKILLIDAADIDITTEEVPA